MASNFFLVLCFLLMRSLCFASPRKSTHEVISPGSTQLSSPTTTVPSTIAPDTCVTEGFKCSSDCRRVTFCTWSNNSLVLNVTEACSGSTPYCNIDYQGCSITCKLSANTPNIPHVTSLSTPQVTSPAATASSASTTVDPDTCQRAGFKCSSDCTRLEFCSQFNINTFLLTVIETCFGATPYCNIDDQGCSETCKISDTTSTLSVTSDSTSVTTTIPPETCQRTGIRCSSDCKRLELCYRKNNTLLLYVMETCSGSTPYCNIDDVSCSTTCKISNDAISTSQVTSGTTTQITSPSPSSNTTDTCHNVGFQCSSDCTRLEYCTKASDGFVLTVLQSCSGNTPYCNIDYVGCSQTCKIPDDTRST